MPHAAVRDIVRKAAVSVATVSRATNGHSNVRPEVRANIDAFFAANDMMTIGTMMTLKRAGIVELGETGIWAFDDIPLIRLISASLKVVGVGLASFGASVVARLVKTIGGGAEQREPIVMVREATRSKLHVRSNRTLSNLHNDKPDQSGIGELR